MFEVYTQHLIDTEHSQNTIKSYLSDAHAFKTWYENSIEKFRIDAITSTDLKEYKQYLHKNLKHKPKTINRKLASLGTLTSWATDENLIQHNIRLPNPIKETPQAPRWLSRTEQNRLRRTLDRYASTRDRNLILLLLNTGLRAGELSALNWSQITLSPRKGLLKVLGKGQKHRQIPLNLEAREALLELGYKELKNTENPVATGQRGRLTTRGLHYIAEEQGRLAKLEGFSTHCC